MSEKKKVFLVDAMALIYRAHFAFINNPRINSKGMNTSAIFGFTTALLEVIDKQNPTHIAVAFDSYEPTVRHTDFTEYKANRDKQPEDITLSLPIIKKILEAFKIPVLEEPGYEADDIVATLTKQIPENEYEVFMFTPDKDYAQLVKENVFLFKPSRGGKPSEVWDIPRVKEEFGIERIDQVVEIQGLMGDAVDNIPGVPGIGPKTAQKLIAEYDNIENLLANTDKLKGKVKENLENHADDARVSKMLATLIIDAPVEFEEEDFKLKEWDMETLESLFAELEFRTLGKKLLGKEPEKKKAEENTAAIGSEEMSSLFDFVETETKEVQSATAFEKSYKEISTDEEIAAMLQRVIDEKKFAIHVETSTPNPYDCRIKSLSFSVSEHEAYFIKISRDEEEAKKVLFKFIYIFRATDIEKIGFELKFIKLVLKKYDLEFTNKLFDNQIAHYIIDSEDRHELPYLVEKYTHYKLMESGAMDTEDFKKMYCEMAEMNLQLFEVFRKEIEANDFQQLFYEVETPLLEVLAEMEYEGVKLNGKMLQDYSVELEKELNELEEKIHKISGIGFKINSPKQLGHVLFEILKLDEKAKKTKSGQYSTSEDVLLKLAPKHEIVQLVLDYRGVQKLKSTYVDALPGLVHESTGRIHTTFDQAVAATGRLSSKNPNLQNIPIRTERGRYTRKAFVSRDDDHLLLSADYSQVELRVIAHASNDESLIAAFNSGYDIHTATASKVFDVELNEVSADMRRKAKEVNFGIIYGISSWGLAQNLGISRKEGGQIKEQYFAKYPKIEEYMEACVEEAQKTGYAKTLLNRRRYLRDINSRSGMQRSFAERNAVNAPIQGTAADLIKIAMVNIYNAFKNMKIKSKMILQVHDELVFDVVKSELDQVKEIVEKEMSEAMDLKVPLLVEMGEGKNWLEAH